MLSRLSIEGREAYLVVPNERPDPTRRWAWIVPYWLGVEDDKGVVQHRFYVETLLARGFHVAGIDVGITFGSPAGSAVFERFYRLLVDKHHLSTTTRLLVQSNGGLIGYGWASRRPVRVDRIAAIYPVLDFRTWPPEGLDAVARNAEPGLGYGLTPEELNKQVRELNAIDRLNPLARAQVKIFHIHGDADEVVPLEPNSLEAHRRYRALGGDSVLKVMAGVGHVGYEAYDSVDLAEFMTG